MLQRTKTLTHLRIKRNKLNSQKLSIIRSLPNTKKKQNGERKLPLLSSSFSPSSVRKNRETERECVSMIQAL